ncbi:MAG TPA: hypothetical protein DD473_17275 [Planctomycetaceae bacterium]|nr:hypothetical protein [Planctomycetaceae bacterium]
MLLRLHSEKIQNSNERESQHKLILVQRSFSFNVSLTFRKPVPEQIQKLPAVSSRSKHRVKGHMVSMRLQIPFENGLIF